MRWRPPESFSLVSVYKTLPPGIEFASTKWPGLKLSRNGVFSDGVRLGEVDSEISKDLYKELLRQSTLERCEMYAQAGYAYAPLYAGEEPETGDMLKRIYRRRKPSLTIDAPACPNASEEVEILEILPVLSTIPVMSKYGPVGFVYDIKTWPRGAELRCEVLYEEWAKRPRHEGPDGPIEMYKIQRGAGLVTWHTRLASTK